MPTLPGFEDLVDEEPLPRRIGAMYVVYGRGPEGKYCGQCQHFLRFQRGGSWSKCELTRMTSGKATDWRARWDACGKFEEAEEKRTFWVD